ncbi:MAG: MoxR family ATPase [Stomatobaculum sp.]|nr:MoxR family ATPase [Stomatobaculum sp.]
MKTEACARRLIEETEKIIIGKRDTIRLVLAAILSGGHVLLEDLPGSGKTTLVKSLSLALGCSMRRVQFTPDLLPADVTGMMVFNQKTGEFQLREGPVNTNILLADELNRAIPRTQSALLEAMEERQVTIDGNSLPLPEPFFVLATQNPVEKESTFPLPAAQLDRFFMKLSMGYPEREEEESMLAALGDSIPFADITPQASPEILKELRKEISGVFVSEHVNRYIVELVHRTREHGSLKSGASPRASRCLYQGGRAAAAMAGRDYVTPDDIQGLFLPVLCHRVQLTSEARYAGTTAEQVLQDILEKTPVPPEKSERFAEKS